MPKLTEKQQNERRTRILDAAENCFTRAGFHRTTMQDICKEAGVSPGAIYTWFESKEALIGGICARNRDDVMASFRRMDTATDFITGMAGALDACVLNQPRAKSVLCLEIAAEATRNPAVAHIMAAFDEAISISLEQILSRATNEGHINPTLPIADLVAAMNAIAEGMFWRRAVDPNFDAVAAGRAFLAMVSAVLRPVVAPPGAVDQSDTHVSSKINLAEQRS